MPVSFLAIFAVICDFVAICLYDTSYSNIGVYEPWGLEGLSPPPPETGKRYNFSGSSQQPKIGERKVFIRRKTELILSVLRHEVSKIRDCLLLLTNTG